MYTNPSDRQAPCASKTTTAAQERWALKLPYSAVKQGAGVQNYHAVKVVSMRDHVVPLMKKFADEAITVVKNIYKNQAWESVVEAIKSGSSTGCNAHYAGSESLHAEVKALIASLKKAGHKSVTLLMHQDFNRDQRSSLLAAFHLAGMDTEVSYVMADVLLNHTIVLGDSDFYTTYFDVSYNPEPPKSVPDVEGNDTVFKAGFKAYVNHSEAVGLVCWKNYSN
jgi:hypothetical protein